MRSCRNWVNNRFVLVIKLLLAFWIGFILISGPVYADWSYMFVVHNERLYIVSDIEVDAKQIGSKVGEVTKFSDREGTYSGNFSNRYPEGTGYYKIIDIKTNNAIAIKEAEGVFKKADYGSPYSESKFNWQELVPYAVGILLLLSILYWINKRILK